MPRFLFILKSSNKDNFQYGFWANNPIFVITDSSWVSTFLPTIARGVYCLSGHSSNFNSLLVCLTWLLFRLLSSNAIKTTIKISRFYYWRTAFCWFITLEGSYKPFLYSTRFDKYLYISSILLLGRAATCYPASEPSIIILVYLYFSVMETSMTLLVLIK